MHRCRLALDKNTTIEILNQHVAADVKRAAADFVKTPRPDQIRCHELEVRCCSLVADSGKNNRRCCPCLHSYMQAAHGILLSGLAVQSETGGSEW